ncbi:hypothetical protein NSK11_contig00155-0001, partial [Nocardia seriolae]
MRAARAIAGTARQIRLDLAASETGRGMAVAALSRIGDVTRNTLSGSTVEARVTDIARRRLNEDIIQQFRSGGGQVGGQF